MTASLFGLYGTRRALLVGCLLVLVFAVAGCSSSYPIQPHYFTDSLFSPSPAIINGIGLTVAISVLAQSIGVLLGVFAAMGKMAKFRPFRLLANFYIWVFRGTPLLVQLAFFRFGLAAAGLFQWPEVIWGPIDILPEVLAGIVILGVNEGAYMAEIVRAGIRAVDPGQTEAAKSLGMTYGKTMSRIVLPQAARVIIPPLGNEFNNMLKTTSLLTFIGVYELYNTFSVAAGKSYAVFELFGACAIWYLLMTTIWGLVQTRIERRFSRGTDQSSSGSTGLRNKGFVERFMSLRAPIEQ
jgi:polar amino acid transport system permease protein